MIFKYKIDCLTHLKNLSLILLVYWWLKIFNFLSIVCVKKKTQYRESEFLSMEINKKECIIKFSIYQ